MRIESRRDHLLGAFFLLAGIEGAAAGLGTLRSYLSESLPAAGIPDLVYLAVLATSWGAALVCILLPLVKSFRGRVFGALDAALSRPRWLGWILLAFALLAYEGIQDLLWLRGEIAPVHYQGYRVILQGFAPLLYWMLGLGVHGFLLVVIHQREAITSWLQTNLKGKELAAGLVVAGLVLGLSQVFPGRRTGQDLINYGPPNAPLLGIQVLLLAGVWLLLRNFLNRHPGWKDQVSRILEIKWVLPVLLLLTAYLVWINTPLGPNYFIDSARPPNYELYPSSDSMQFDILSQRLLLGYGFPLNRTPGHPFYPAFLAFLHLLTGDGFVNTLPVQVLILSFFPVLLYQLVLKLNTRNAAVLVGLLYIIKERNALLLGEHITVMNSKIFMTEPLVGLGILLFLVLFLKWMDNPSGNTYLMILAGGVLCLSALIRIEAALILPVSLLFAAAAFRKQLKTWFRGALAAAGAFLIILSPWIVHNLQARGTIGIDNLDSLTASSEIFLERLVPDASLEGQEGPVGDPDSDAQAADPDQGSGVQRYTRADKFPDHFVDSLRQGFYFLPNNHQPLLTAASLGDLVFPGRGEGDLEGDPFGERYLERYVRSLPYWFRGWDGHLVLRSYLPVLLSAFLVGLGLSQLRGDTALKGGLLGGVFFAHVLVNAFMGFSGERFIFPVEWILLVFFGMGLTRVISGLEAGSQSSRELKRSTGITFSGSQESWIRVLAALGLVGIAGLVLPVLDGKLVPAYTEAQLEMIGEGENLDYNLVEQEGMDPELRIAYGKALYPRFFGAGEQVEDSRSNTLPDPSYSRVEFYLIGTQQIWITLPVEESPEAFPHGSEVVVIGKKVIRELDPDGRRIFGSHLQAQRILILESRTRQVISVLECSGELCSLEY